MDGYRCGEEQRRERRHPHLAIEDQASGETGAYGRSWLRQCRGREQVLRAHVAWGARPAFIRIMAVRVRRGRPAKG